MTPFVWKQGFRAAIGEDEAKATAVADVTRYYAGLGYAVSALVTTVVRTADHDAAGEYLVRVVGSYTVDGGA